MSAPLRLEPPDDDAPDGTGTFAAPATRPARYVAPVMLRTPQARRDEFDRHLSVATPDERAGMLSEAQTREARETLFRPVEHAVSFPYGSLDALVDRLTEGRLVVFAANTGQGKTTFLLDVVHHWATVNRHVVHYLGLEQSGAELRTKVACYRAQVPVGIAISRSFDRYPNGDAMRDAVDGELAVMDSDDDMVQSLVFEPEVEIDVPRIERAARTAAKHGASVLVIDHINRFAVGQGQNEYTEHKKFIRRLKELAGETGLVILGAAQMNREARGGDRLASHRPPQTQHLRSGGHVEEEADVILGAWKPIRSPNPNESPKDYRDAVTAAREGTVEKHTILMPGTMAIEVLKHRTWGQNEGKRTMLSLTPSGRLSDKPVREFGRYDA